MLLNNYIKNKIKFHLLSKRCPDCYSEYSKESIMITQQFGYTDKQQFLVQDKPKSLIPVKEHGRRPINTGEIVDLYSTRYAISLVKPRIHSIILAVTMCCGRCGLCKDISVDLDKLR